MGLCGISYGGVEEARYWVVLGLLGFWWAVGRVEQEIVPGGMVLLGVHVGELYVVDSGYMGCEALEVRM